MKYKDGVITQIATMIDGKPVTQQPTEELRFFMQLADLLSKKATTCILKLTRNNN